MKCFSLQGGDCCHCAGNLQDCLRPLGGHRGEGGGEIWPGFSDIWKVAMLIMVIQGYWLKRIMSELRSLKT